ncbi:MAG: hypothetical protein VX189_06835, partial [Planctomycetota bacterium]|nr:hypothetical protein [Planctomycetota bacterium]
FHVASGIGFPSRSTHLPRKRAKTRREMVAATVDHATWAKRTVGKLLLASLLKNKNFRVRPV